MEKLYMIIPAYNEEKNIEDVIKNWHRVVSDIVDDENIEAHIVVIDDGSKDNTYKILCEYAKEYPFLMPLTKTNGGHGETLLYGYRYAIRGGADWIFQTDSDGQTLPEEFYGFWTERHEYDAILGMRPERKDGRSRFWVENILCFILRILFGVKVPDANAPFRLMKANLVEKYISKLPESYNLPNVMFTTYFAYFGENLVFRKITFQPRQGGKNSINIKKIVAIGWKAVFDFIDLKKHIED